MKALAALGLALLAVGCKPGGIKREAELCAKAAAMFQKCETLEGDPIQKDLQVDRWRGLCRAVFTGETDQLLPNALPLYQAMDEATKAALREQAECTAKTVDCTAYATCDD